ncbi:efflux transporter outer membrane subunit [Porphyrobacter algicida]|uniref:Efflux transporter outer membrane subunit n=1 Tax=Qipengyuania algicida TaxID=1836209 RepID=A0A845ADU0_9SPHN|nr:efflux transporter outer membrane subunit [Qipengyuania algicida]MXP27657.1 efflux transporter outer membrane subunit [Qipengyuania algicida]
MMFRRAAALLASVSLTACSLAPKTVLPPPPVPASWPVGDAYLARSEAKLPVVSYTEVFRDRRLQQLIGQALINNRDLRVAAANIVAARAQVRATRAQQFPQIGVTGSVTRTENGSGTTAPTTGTGSTAGRSGSYTLYSVQGGVSSYALDFFGQYANATKAQRDQAIATEAAARTVRLTLVADIATAWATYAADKDLLALAQATADNAQQAVKLTRARFEGGIAPRTDLSQAEQILASAQDNIALQTTALAKDVNLLRLLVGGPVEETLLPDSLSGIADSFVPLPAGLSSDVLLRRPDVIEAEYQLRAANANIGVARAKLFPSISLTGLLGFASTALADLFTGDAFKLTAGADASYSIFDAGGKRADVVVSEAQRDAALATYEKAIQTAFREVSDSLATQGTIGERLRANTANANAAATTAKLTDARYKNGIDSFLDSLVAQRSLYSARQSQVSVELASILNRVTLYQVLGGDQLARVSQTTAPSPGE